LLRTRETAEASHEAKRDVLKGHSRADESRPLTGVFYTILLFS
jgi:hypothetical protein